MLEPFASHSAFAEAGERVVVMQRIMQAASDLFLGWSRSPGLQPAPGEEDARQRQLFVRRLEDARLAAAAQR